MEILEDTILLHRKLGRQVMVRSGELGVGVVWQARLG